MTEQAVLTRDTLISKYDGRAPRYTSYPTAAQFTPAVDETAYRRWLAELPPSAPVSLYAHIPFCKRLCWYCGCNTRSVNRSEPIRDYVALMLQEIAMVREALPGRLPARAVHLGGGTPNMLERAELEAIFGALRQAFLITSDAEISAELDPAVLTREWVDAAADMGLNRASLGVQNLAPEVQAAVNRRESFAEIQAAFGWLRAAGVTSINVDLMYGLPAQTFIGAATIVRRRRRTLTPLNALSFGMRPVAVLTGGVAFHDLILAFPCLAADRPQSVDSGRHRRAPPPVRRRGGSDRLHPARGAGPGLRPWRVW